MPCWQSRAATSFSTGLLRAIEKPTLRVLSTVAGPVVAPLGELFHDDYAWWDPEALWRAQWGDLPPGGSLLIDDTVICKDHTTCTEGAYPNFSGQHKRVVLGHTFLTLLYVSPEGGARLLWMKLWRPGGANKLEMARQAIEQLLEAGLKPADVSFDGWFFELGFVNWLSSRKLIWTTRVRRNRKFFFPGGHHLSPEQWEKTVPMETWHYYRERRGYAKSAEVAAHNFPPVKLVALKHHRHGKADRFLLTNDRHAGIRTVFARYGRRWGIEVLFRFTKQKLGLSTYRHLSAIAAERHVALVGLVWNFLNELSLATEIPIGKLKRLAEKPTRTGIPSIMSQKTAA